MTTGRSLRRVYNSSPSPCCEKRCSRRAQASWAKPQEADRQQCQPVDRDGHAFGADMVQGFGDEPLPSWPAHPQGRRRSIAVPARRPGSDCGAAGIGQLGGHVPALAAVVAPEGRAEAAAGISGPVTSGPHGTDAVVDRAGLDGHRRRDGDRRGGGRRAGRPQPDAAASRARARKLRAQPCLCSRSISCWMSCSVISRRQ